MQLHGSVFSGDIYLLILFYHYPCSTKTSDNCMEGSKSRALLVIIGPMLGDRTLDMTFQVSSCIIQTLADHSLYYYNIISSIIIIMYNIIYYGIVSAIKWQPCIAAPEFAFFSGSKLIIKM